MNKHVSKTAPTWPMSSEKVNFTNGMIVTADDLKAAMQYSVSLMQITNRAVFGCGVICGFELNPHPGLCGTPEDIEVIDCDGKEKQVCVYPSYQVEVGPGTAMDCHGLPIELCKPMLVDLSPDICGCDPKTGGTVCILIRRIEASEDPRGDCCGGGTLECSRIRDHVKLRGYASEKDMPEHYCGHPPQTETDPCAPDDMEEHKAPLTTCECLKICDDCTCCGDGWVLLGCVELTSHGVIAWKTDPADTRYEKMLERRKYIKTIECACLPHSHPHSHDENRPEGETPQFVHQQNKVLKQVVEVIESKVTKSEYRKFLVASKPVSLEEVVTTLDAIESEPEAAKEIFRADFIRRAPGYRDEIKREIETRARSGKTS